MPERRPAEISAAKRRENAAQRKPWRLQFLDVQICYPLKFHIPFVAESRYPIGHPYGHMSIERKPRQGSRSQELRFIIETELENDGRWFAEIPQVPARWPMEPPKKRPSIRHTR